MRNHTHAYFCILFLPHTPLTAERPNDTAADTGICHVPAMNSPLKLAAAMSMAGLNICCGGGI